MPIGVLYDSEIAGQGDQLAPWDVTVHFQHFPSSEVLPCDRLADSEKLYFHSLKQALHLLHGSTRLYNEFTIASQERLWRAVCSADGGEYAAAASPLLPVDARAIGRLPVRLVYSDTLDQRSRCLQRPVACVSCNGCALRTLSDVLTEDFAPFMEGTAPRLSEQQQQQRQVAAASVPKTEWCRFVMIQGIEVPLDAPAIDVWQLMHHCDLFLYISLPRT